MKKLAMLVATAFAVLSFPGIDCYAGGDVIHGCYQKHGGDLRIVSNAKWCRHSEIPISWNKTGPQGPAGPEGPIGPAGPQALEASQRQDPRVYDVNGNLLGVYPSIWEGFLSFFVPTLSRFLVLSPGSGDVDPAYPSVSLYYDGVGCTGNSFLDVNVRYQILKVGSQYLTAGDGLAVCTNNPDTNIMYVSTAQWNEMGQFSRRCDQFTPDQAVCTLVVQTKEVTLPFSLPLDLPVHFE